MTRFIRASLTPAYSDCPRRSAAKAYRNMVVAAGFDLRELPPSIGAAVGTAAHAAAMHTVKMKMDTGELGKVADGLEIAFQAFREEIAPGAVWDDTTPTRMVAEQQIERLVQAYMPVAATLNPAMVETELRAEFAPGWTITGRVDVYEGGDAPGPDDLKTGALVRPYQAQLGTYALLLKSNGHAVMRAGTTFIKRVRMKAAQPAPIRTVYELAETEKDAYKAITDIVRDVTEFEKSGDPRAFAANPMSLLCSDKYCPARNTPFCKSHLKEEQNNGPID